MLFANLVDLLVKLEKTNSRNLMTEMIAEFLGETEMQEIKQVCYLLIGQLGPMYARIDFGLADKMVVRAVALASNQDVEKIKQQYQTVGDLGQVVAIDWKQLAQTKATIAQVYQRLINIAEASGKGSQEQKISLLAELLQEANSDERKYIVRMVLAKMRLGFSDKTILDALAVMNNGSKAGRIELEKAYQVFPDIGVLAEVVKKQGLAKLDQAIQMDVGVPVMPALAQRLNAADEMIAKMGRVIVEPKFDGTRVQVHVDRSRGIVRSFARSLEENSAMFPELIEAVQQIQAKSIILDCEAVGYDPVTKKIKPFQDTITRKRKHGINEMSQQIPIKFFCFDVLYRDGESLLNKPLTERRKILAEAIRKGGAIEVDEFIETNNAETLRLYHAEKLAEGLEGALVKKFDGEYQPGRTGWNWVKFKEVENSRGKLKDTIDGVVMGYYRGKGKRNSFGVGAFLLGVWDNQEDMYVTIAKVGTGLTDEQWKELKVRADSEFVESQPERYKVAEGIKPDVWVEPKIVVEVAADEMTKSPMHSAGVGLRFPRLIRFRDDKNVSQITTIAELSHF